MLKVGSIVVTGITAADYRCPICSQKAHSKLSKGDWIICKMHGLIEGVRRIAVLDDFKLD
jgi:ribosomal protein L37AE/L43A